MIAIDSNVLVRLAVRDDVKQLRRAEQLFEQAAAVGHDIVISIPVLLETVWAMRKTYKIAQSEVAAFLRRLMETRGVVIDDLDLAGAAVAAYSRGRADFADYVIAFIAVRAGASTIYSFDQDGLDEGLFKPVPA